MRLVLATDDFKIHGLSFKGFPILLDDSMEIVEPANSFLIDVCITNGRAKSERSWARYGQDIYDFLGYTTANNVDWRAIPKRGRPGPIEKYRNWASKEVGHRVRTINQRLRTIRRFYDWCAREGVVDQVPYRTVTVRNPRATRFLQHADTTGGRTESPYFMLRELKEPLKVLTKAQCEACISALDGNETHQLLFRLILLTGLRNREACTFPESYVFDPTRVSRLTGKAFVRIALDPNEMTLKGDKAREIDVPVALMEDLYWWSVKQRQARANAQQGKGDPSTALFLTTHGNAFSQNAIGSMFRALKPKVGFDVYPHLLRHTWATHTLYFLRRTRWKGDPLLYVQRRLGHASLNTTLVYLHLLDELDAELIGQHDAELDVLFSGDIEGLQE